MAAKPTSKRTSRSRAKPSRKKSARPKAEADEKDSKRAKKSLRCPIVGVGGSAGGFEATMELLKKLPSKPGMAFVIVQHLDPHHASRLPNLLSKATPMPVIEINGRMKTEPNTVYVQPANKCVTCKKGALNLVRRTERLNVAIDLFFESLAEDQGPRAIGIVLSGTGSDGTAGLRAIKAAGGITFAQDETTAKFSAMPRNAILAGFVDAALSPREMARELGRIAEHPYIRKAPQEDAESLIQYADLDDLSRIFFTLKKHTGVDFNSYKQTTLQRRIHRRMALHRIERLERYASFLRGNEKEINELFNDLLINVTHFFRDERAFRSLQTRFIPALIKQKSHRGGELRVWVPGCATGEEVYSLAICILEVLGAAASRIAVQVFGTDLSEPAIERARLGVYSTSIEKDVSPKRLQRFFKKLDSTYQINRSVRDICTFARQNITADPPFSRIDLISCRNVLIYLGPELQKRAVPIFHYALNSGGYLILGPSETVGIFNEMFELVDKRAKIYAKKITRGRSDFDALPRTTFSEVRTLKPARLAAGSEGRDFDSQVQRVVDRILLGTYGPSGVVVDEALNVRQFRGKTAPYLEHTAGPANLNLLHMAKASLVPDLRAIVHRAMGTGRPARKGCALVKSDSHVDEVSIDVVPFKVPTSDKTWALVLFSQPISTEEKRLPKSKRKRRTESEVDRLRDELTASKESLQAIIEEQEATNEELKSANEEIESSNEELQSSNEELETAKEELQSTNEELTTLNEELGNRNLEIMQINSDLSNLLSSIHLPIVMVDNNLMIRRATPTAREAFNITTTDVDRRITDLKPNVNIPDLEKLLRDVIETLSVRVREVCDKQGRSYSLRIRPYRTEDNRIDGAVLTLVDISGEKS